MSTTATLSELERASSLEDFGSCALEKGPASLPIRCVCVAGNGVWEVGITFLMVVLAPVVLVLLAGSFVVACLRMQYEGEAGEPAEAKAAENWESFKSPVRELGQIRGRGVVTLSSYLWN